MKKAILLATLLLPSCVGTSSSNAFNPEMSSPVPNSSFCGGLIDTTVLGSPEDEYFSVASGRSQVTTIQSTPFATKR